MRHRSSIPKDPDTDPNVTAFNVVKQATATTHRASQNVNTSEVFGAVSSATETDPAPGEPAKNAAAVMLGRLGGLKGGKARAKALTKKKRRAIAKKAARARWRSDK